VAKTKTNTQDMTVVAFVNGRVQDQFGSEVKKGLSAGHVRKLKSGKTALRLVKTKTGGKQWRAESMSVYNNLVKNARPLDVVDNRNDEEHVDIEKFINDSVALRPANLIINDLRWKYLMRSVVRGKNIMMTGPSGCGKTLAVQSVAKALEGRPYFYFNLGATTDPRSTLIGNTHYSKDKGTFVADALFVQAIQQENAIILMDELTRATPDAWNILITVLDENQRYLRIDEKPDTPTVKVAKGVTFIATANIGAEYTATRVLDRAMLDRFTAIVEMEALNIQDEVKLLTMTYPNMDFKTVESIAAIADHTRNQVKSEDPKVTTAMSSRMTVEMAGIIYDGFTLAEAAEVCIYPFFSDAGGVDSERTYMKQLVQKFLPTTSTGANPWDKPATDSTPNLSF
jgi:Holliday junction resolvasome RuvABC ATP-dependent DNA helicase subunit